MTVDHAANNTEEVFNDRPADRTSVAAIAVAVNLDPSSRLTATRDKLVLLSDTRNEAINKNIRLPTRVALAPLRDALLTVIQLGRPSPSRSTPLAHT